MGKVINFPLSLKALAMLTIAALVGVAVDLTRPKPLNSAVLGSEWQCKQTAFVITTCALRSARREAVPALETTSKWPFGLGSKPRPGQALASRGHCCQSL